MKKVVVVGGGAAGLMAAIAASFNSLDKKHQRQVIAYSGFLEREEEWSRYNKK